MGFNLLLIPVGAFACSGFSLSVKGCSHCAYTGHSFDWPFGRGFGFVQARGLTKTAFLPDKSPQALHWISKYGSLSFSPAGPGLTVTGVNEVGLSVMDMELQEDMASQGPGYLPAINELQFPQYLLDTSASLQEALQNANAVRIQFSFFPLHYLVCDATGACAALEYLKGAWTIHEGNELPVGALTNSTYDSSLQSWKDYSANPKLGLPTNNSLARFVTLAETNAEYMSQQNPVAYTFAALAKVAQSSQPGSSAISQWNTVYSRHESRDATLAIRADFKTLASPILKSVDLHQLDFQCGKALLALDMDSAGSGDMSHGFKPFAPSDQAALDIQSEGVGVDEDLMAQLDQYLQSTSSNCAE